MRAVWLTLLVLASLCCPAGGQDLPKLTDARKKRFDALLRACLEARAVVRVGKGASASFQIDAKKLRGVLAERRKELDDELRQTILAAWVEVAVRLEPVCIELLEALGQEAPDAQALGLAAFLRARTLEAEHDLPGAATSYEQAIRHFKERKEATWQATSLNNLGAVLHAQSEEERAMQAFLDAQKLYQLLYPVEKYPHGHPLLANCHNNLGSVLRAQGEYTRALEQYRLGLSMRQRLYPPEKYPEGHPDLANSHSNLGGILKLQGEYVEALAQYTQALEMVRKLYPVEKFPRGHPHLVQCLNNLGAGLDAKGEPIRAREHRSLALQMARQLYPVEKFPRGHPDLAVPLLALGTSYQAQGDHGKAQEHYTLALQMCQRLYPVEQYPRGHPQLAECHTRMGRVLERKGESDRAQQQYRLALNMFQRLYPTEKYPRGHPLLAGSHLDLGNILRDQGQYAEALTQCRLAVEMQQRLYPVEKYPRGHPDLSHSNTLMGLTWKAEGQYDLAVKQLERALELVQLEYPAAKYPGGHPNLASCHHNLGSALRERGDHVRALEHLSRALQMQVKFATGLAAEASEATALNHAASLPLTCDLLLTVTALTGETPANTYTRIAQSKASLSRIFERRQIALAAAAADPRTAGTFDRLINLRRTREGILLAVLPPSVAERQRRDERLAQLEQEIEAAEKEILPLLPAVPRAAELARSTPEDLRKALPTDTVLVDLLRYFRFAQNPKVRGKKGEIRTPCYVAFVVTRDGIHRVDLGEAVAIEKALALWRNVLTGSASRPETEEKVAADLRRLVWEPIASVLPVATTTVFISPDQALAQLPWAALPGRKPGTVLLEDHALAVVPHGVFLLDKLTAPASKGKASSDLLLAVGGVAYDDTPPVAEDFLARADLPRAGVVGTVGKLWDALPGTALELERIKNLAGKTVEVRSLAGKQAGIEQVRKALPQARLAHFATHGFFADATFRSVLQLDEQLFLQGRFTDERIGAGARNPLVLSGLVLAGANRSDAPDRGILSADAVVSLPLQNLHLAVLSACETGLGETAGGEGVFGLQRAFHLAGTANVVASLWKVEDEATAALMELFYRNLWQEKLPPLEALERAQLALRYNPGKIKEWSQGRGPKVGVVLSGSTPSKPAKETGRATTSARLWAAFTLSGLGR